MSRPGTALPPVASPGPAEDARACVNCGAELTGPYCSACGQRSRDLHVSFSALVHEFLHDYLHLDGKLARTLWLLFRRPGFLTQEYMRGRRARYAGPFQLYLVTSMLLFVTLSLLPSSGRVALFGLESEGAPSPTAVTPGAGGAGAATTSPKPADSEVLEVFETLAPSKVSSEKDRQRLAALGPEGIRHHLLSTFSADAPKAMLLLLPIVALLLKAVARRRYFVEHLVFALHLHAAAFLMLTGGWLARVSGFAAAAVFAYALAASRAYYAWSWLRAGVATLFVALVYSVALLVALLGLVMLGVLTA